jgi:hypothetical protein
VIIVGWRAALSAVRHHRLDSPSSRPSLHHLDPEAVSWLQTNFLKTELEPGHCLRTPAEEPCEYDLVLTCSKFLTHRPLQLQAEAVGGQPLDEHVGLRGQPPCRQVDDMELLLRPGRHNLMMNGWVHDGLRSMAAPALRAWPAGRANSRVSASWIL